MDIELKAVLEGLLFIVGDEGLTIESCQEVLEVDTEKANSLINELVSKYKSNEHGVEIVNFAHRYKFVSKPFVHSYAEKLFKQELTKKLSPAALETLAIIAYKQPITRVEIEEIRGVNCDLMIRKLVARDLIKEIGRSEALGRPFLYGITDTFLDTFKMVDINELPALPDYNDEQEEIDLYE